MVTTKSEHWRGSCTEAQAAPTDSEPHMSWDLDIGDIRSWLRAQRVCREQCPFLEQCRSQRNRLYPYPVRNPQAVIWAGVAYSETGKILDTPGLRRLWATQRGRDQRDVDSWSTATG